MAFDYTAVECSRIDFYFPIFLNLHDTNNPERELVSLSWGKKVFPPQEQQIDSALELWLNKRNCQGFPIDNLK